MCAVGWATMLYFGCVSVFFCINAKITEKGAHFSDITPGSGFIEQRLALFSL